MRISDPELWPFYPAANAGPKSIEEKRMFYGFLIKFHWGKPIKCSILFEIVTIIECFDVRISNANKHGLQESCFNSNIVEHICVPINLNHRIKFVIRIGEIIWFQRNSKLFSILYINILHAKIKYARRACFYTKKITRI